MPAAVSGQEEVTVRFVSSAYTVSEGDGTVGIAVEISESPSFDVRVGLVTYEGEAVGGRDYGRDEPVTFLAGTTTLTQTIRVLIYDDNVVEGAETFSVEIGSSAAHSLEARTVTIHDDDETRLGFLSDEHRATEGESVLVCIDHSGRTALEFAVSISYSDPDGALSSEQTFTPSVTFRPFQLRQCITVSVNQVSSDAVVEFTITEVIINPEVVDRVRIVGRSASVTVQDTGRFPREPEEDFDTLTAAGNTWPEGIWSDGATMWVADYQDDKIYAYNMSSKERDEGKDFNTLNGAGNNDPAGLWSDGTTMWVVDHEDVMVYAYDMEDKTRDQTKDFDNLTDAGLTHPEGIWSDATTVWISEGGRPGAKIYAYTLMTKEREPDKDIDALASAMNLNTHALWSDGTTIWAVEHVGERPENIRVFAYGLATQDRQEIWDNDNLIPAGNIGPRGVWSNGGTMWVSDEYDSKVYRISGPVEEAQNQAPAGDCTRRLRFSRRIRPCTPIFGIR